MKKPLFFKKKSKLPSKKRVVFRFRKKEPKSPRKQKISKRTKKKPVSKKIIKKEVPRIKKIRRKKKIVPIQKVKTTPSPVLIKKIEEKKEKILPIKKEILVKEKKVIYTEPRRSVKKPKLWARIKTLVSPVRKPRLSSGVKPTVKKEVVQPSKPLIPKSKPKIEKVIPPVKPQVKLKVKKLKPEEAAEIKEISKPKIKIKVIGIGGGGSTIVNELVPKIKGVDFILVNTDIQALKMAKRDAKKFFFGHSITHGLGTGMNPKLGQEAAEKDKNKIKKLLEGTNLCFLVSCLGGGTGSGASPVFVKTARDLGILTVGIFALPFDFEGKVRREIAKESLKNLQENINAFAIIFNEKIFQMIDKKTSFREALGIINNNIIEGLQGLLEMINLPGVINVDFADLKTILGELGQLVYLGCKTAGGEKRTEEVIEEILSNPLYDYEIKGTRAVLFNIAGGKSLSMQEVEQIGESLRQAVNPEAKIIFGIRQDEKYKDRVEVTLLAVGGQSKFEARGDETSEEKKGAREDFETFKKKKEIQEKTESEIREAQEKEFEIPTFLRKKTEEK